MIMYSFRELFALFLSLFGIYLILQSLQFVQSSLFIESSVCAVVGIMVLKTGAYMFRVAMSARILYEETKSANSKKL